MMKHYHIRASCEPHPSQPIFTISLAVLPNFLLGLSHFLRQSVAIIYLSVVVIYLSVVVIYLSVVII